MTRHVVLAAAIVCGAAVAASAHHSFPAYYFEDQSMSVEGELVEFDYRAPHAWVHVRGLDDSGAMQTFAAEWANPRRLSRDSVTKDTLQPGDHVIVTGAPGRKAEEHRLHLRTIERPADGWRWGDARRGDRR